MGRHGTATGGIDITGRVGPDAQDVAVRRCVCRRVGGVVGKALDRVLVQRRRRLDRRLGVARGAEGVVGGVGVGAAVGVAVVDVDLPTASYNFV